MRRVLVVGGFGAVGRVAAVALAETFPEVVAAGRRPGRLPGVGSLPLDVTDAEQLRTALDGADAVLMCADRDNARLARACVERGVHYVDVTASWPVMEPIESLRDRATARSAVVALSVGLAPGVTNLLARLVADGSAPIEIGVLLGTGERHGAAAVDWTLDSLAAAGPTWPVQFPAPYGRRPVRGFPFSDQVTLRRTLGVADVRTGLALDSRLLTAALPLAAPLAGHRWLRAAVKRVHVGGDGFAVAASCGAAVASWSGRGQSRATGLVAAAVVERLRDLPPGVHHLDQLVDPASFLTALAGHGFVFTGPGAGA